MNAHDPGSCCPSQPPADPQDSVADPVCGMQVDPAKAAAEVVHAETTHYFCSERCAEKFRAEPVRYLEGG